MQPTRSTLRTVSSPPVKQQLLPGKMSYADSLVKWADTELAVLPVVPQTQLPVLSQEDLLFNAMVTRLQARDAVINIEQYDDAVIDMTAEFKRDPWLLTRRASTKMIDRVHKRLDEAGHPTTKVSVGSYVTFYSTKIDDN